jgi:hypothetical protein
MSDEPVTGEGRQGLERLWALQQVDSRLAAARAGRAALDDGAGLRAEVEEARGSAVDSALRLHEAQAAIKDHELQLAGQTAEDRGRSVRRADFEP